ncbi:Translationally-controlled tumor protein [Tolypocladium capitatum]|uniref:Translationally-controlled tumor protein homolog n=1 Tax=Tolypocladium capitatum TaxID=45235 RepID=A0A2K3QR97_9HYPO|nr:Translationally-controlled tumor protein [Tolypocladium capitatum]
MKIYNDILTGDEIISDSYDLKEIDGIVYEADCAMITEEAVNIDTGANASAEGGDDDAVEDQAIKVNNIIRSFRLQSTQFDKKGYLGYLKGAQTTSPSACPWGPFAHIATNIAASVGYLKAVKAALQERGADADTITTFEKGAQAYVKDKLLPNFKDFEFYTGESMNPDGLIVLLNYRDDGVTPYVIIWKHGVKETKV